MLSGNCFPGKGKSRCEKEQEAFTLSGSGSVRAQYLKRLLGAEFNRFFINLDKNLDFTLGSMKNVAMFPG